MSEEYLDIVNEQDEVVGKRKREVVYRENFIHRIVIIVIQNDRGELALQLRGKNLSYMPLAWASTACGHVTSGEDYTTAANRELAEEAGIEIPLKFISKDYYVNLTDKFKSFMGVFSGVWNGGFKFPGNEVENIRFFSIEQVKNMIQSGEKFHPETLAALQRHFLSHG